MHDPEFTFLRRNGDERQAIDEFAVRFVYAGEGIDHAPVAPGDFVELKRVRILEVSGGKVVSEICIENWTVLPVKSGREPLARRAVPSWALASGLWQDEQSVSRSTSARLLFWPAPRAQHPEPLPMMAPPSPLVGSSERCGWGRR